eukprot:COSAG02_NODE_254_length_26937_cov_16.503950_5_plen_170_part_00
MRVVLVQQLRRNSAGRSRVGTRRTAQRQRLGRGVLQHRPRRVRCQLRRSKPVMMRAGLPYRSSSLRRSDCSRCHRPSLRVSGSPSRRWVRRRMQLHTQHQHPRLQLPQWQRNAHICSSCSGGSAVALGRTSRLRQRRSNRRSNRSNSSRTLQRRPFRQPRRSRNSLGRQ